jgi:hypothetical protein
MPSTGACPFDKIANDEGGILSAFCALMGRFSNLFVSNSPVMDRSLQDMKTPQSLGSNQE